MSSLRDVMELVALAFDGSDYCLIENTDNTIGIVNSVADSVNGREVFLITVKPAKLIITEKED